MKLRKVLVTTDLSDESRSAVEYAAWLADGHGAEVVLLYCVDNIPSVAYHTVDLTFDRFREELVRQERRRLDAFAASFGKRLPVPLSVVMTEGNAAAAILRYAEKHRIDQIVMNTHGRTGIQHAVLGSIAEKVVRHAPCPVTTIRSASAPRSRSAARRVPSR